MISTGRSSSAWTRPTRAQADRTSSRRNDIPLFARVGLCPSLLCLLCFASPCLALPLSLSLCFCLHGSPLRLFLSSFEHTHVLSVPRFPFSFASLMLFLFSHPSQDFYCFFTFFPTAPPAFLAVGVFFTPTAGAEAGVAEDPAASSIPNSMTVSQAVVAKEKYCPATQPRTAPTRGVRGQACEREAKVWGQRWGEREQGKGGCKRSEE